MSKSVSQLLEEVGDVRSNPANIQKVVLESLEQMNEGDYDVVDPSNPFVFLVESASVTAAASMQQMEAQMRGLYPSMAQTHEDLYRHMADVDYANRFDQPGSATMTFILSLDEVRERAIDQGNGVRIMTIPKDTEVVVEGMHFTLYYPIDIRVMPHGGVQVLYDVSEQNPLKTLESNLVDWEIVKMPPNAEQLANVELLTMRVAMDQFRIQDYYDQLNDSSGFLKRFEYSNNFYFARVYISNSSDSEWREISTTHSPYTYDPETPTARLRVLDGELEVSIPQIYFTRSMLGRGIRIDIYSTQGAVEQNLQRYAPRNFRARWRDLRRHPSETIEPVRAFSTISIFSDDAVSGGHRGLTFEETRERVIHNSTGPMELPITQQQLEQQVEREGYRIVSEIDNITHRVYLATRALPDPEGDDLSTAIGATVATVQASFDDLIGLDGVHNNGRRITLDAGMVFRMDRGIVRLVQNGVIDGIENDTPEGIVSRAMSENYIYTPFHYVLDATDDRFESRVYDLDRPGIEAKQFQGENETTRLAVSTMRYGISKNDDGYRIVVTTASGESFRALEDGQVHAQMSFVPPGEADRASLVGEFMGRTDDDEFMFEFAINTNFDIDDQHELILEAFSMFGEDELAVSTPLKNEIDLIYLVSNYDVADMRASNIDSLVDLRELPNDATAVVHETLNIRFGTSLDGLWQRARSVADSVSYERYEQDIEATYENTVYERDANGAIVISYDSGSGEISYQIKHQAGDPVLDGDGNPILAHEKGEVKVDNDGNPIIKNNRRTTRQMDLLFFEGIFAFVTESASRRYARQTRRTIVDWITQQIESLSSRLLENTQLWFQPTATMGDVSVYVENGISTTIDSQQSFQVRYYLTDSAYNNTNLRQDLIATAKEVIRNHLEMETISVTAMAHSIIDQLGEDILDVTVSGLGGDNNYEMLSVTDRSRRLGVKKRLTVLADNEIAAEDDITIEFIRHSA